MKSLLLGGSSSAKFAPTLPSFPKNVLTRFPMRRLRSLCLAASIFHP